MDAPQLRAKIAQQTPVEAARFSDMDWQEFDGEDAHFIDCHFPEAHFTGVNFASARFTRCPPRYGPSGSTVMSGIVA